MGKKKISLTIEEELWDDANHRIKNKSKFVETALRSYLYGDVSEEEEIVEEIEDLTSQLEILKVKLCALRESRRKSLTDDESFEAPMMTLNRLYGALGYVGENQIKKFARIHNVDERSLKKHIVKKGWKIMPFAEVNKNLK